MVKRRHGSYTNLPDDMLKDAAVLGHQGLAMAWRGEFDKIWANAPDIDGKSQREWFFENVTRWLPKVDAEALRRRLHLK